MKSVICSTKLPADLREASKLRAAHLGYRSWNAYIIGLIREDAAGGVSHDLPLAIAGLPGHQRDAIDAQILEGCQLASAGLEHENIVQMPPPAEKMAAIA